MARRAVIEVGVLRNPQSSANRGRPAAPDAPGVLTIETAAPCDLPAALARLRDAGARAVVVDGGDGAVRETVTLIPAIFGDTAPSVSFLPHGNTNLIARNLGALSGPASVGALAAALRAGRTPPVRRAALLRVDFDDGRPPLRGFMMGWAAYERATRMAIEEIEARGAAQVRRAVAIALRRALLGPQARTLRVGASVQLTIDGVPAAPGQSFIGLVTTLPGRLTAGFNPFWGVGDGPMRWLDVRAPAPGLARGAPLTALGRPMRWMRAAGYRSGRARRIALTLDSGFVLDGERFAGGALSIAAEETLAVTTL